LTVNDYFTVKYKSYSRNAKMVFKLGKRKDLTYWNIPVPRALDQAVEEAVKRDMHVSKSDLVRDAVRRLLREIGIQEGNERSEG